ncbi:MAG: tetratricopeptide repeat protein [Candidatus Omnitrophica bacterium]|nr:tetratricopeptide repeat protein [Candidatus Omnitrophota bacterium]
MKVFVTVAIGIFLISFLAASIDAYNGSFLAARGISGTEKDVLSKIFGGFKEYLSDMSFVRADVYFHGGIYNMGKCEHGPCKENLHVAGEAEHAHEHRENHGHDLPDKIGPNSNILLELGKAIGITEHRHLSGNEEKEIVPWIYYSVKLNPHNIEAYSVGAFWLAIKLKNPDKAITLLKEGVTANPDSWEIYTMLGYIYFIVEKNYANAENFLEKAKKFGDAQKVDKFEKRRIYTLLAEIYIKKGRETEAIELYKELLELFPEDETLRKKISGLNLTAPSAAVHE